MASYEFVIRDTPAEVLKWLEQEEQFVHVMSITHENIHNVFYIFYKT
jgi:hypothetical protein